MISLLSNRLKNSKDLSVETQKDLYLSGEELIGRVTFDPKKHVNTTCVKVYFCGEEFCAWTDRMSQRIGGPPSTGDIKLFRKEQELVSGRARFAAGMHSWPFRFVVPRNIPPSCIYKRGQACVAYFLKAKVCTGFGRFDMVHIYPIIVGQLWIPVQPITVYNNVARGGLNVRVHALCSHSVAKCDEVVNCHVEIRNDSNRQIEAIRIKLKQVWECSEVFHHKNAVYKVECKTGFPAGNGQETRDIPLTIPSYLVLVPTISNANLFKCTYYIGVYMVMKFGGLIQKERVKCHLPIIISNIPTNLNVPVPQMPVYVPPPLQRSRSHQEVIMQPSNFNGGLSQMRANFQELLSNEDGPSHNEAESGGSAVSRALDRVQSSPAVVSGSDYNPFTNPLSVDSPPHESSNGTNDGESKSECIICFDGPKNMLVLPCAHIATCVTCTAHIMRTTKKCPVCRGTVTQVLRTYQV